MLGEGIPEPGRENNSSLFVDSMVIMPTKYGHHVPLHNKPLYSTGPTIKREKRFVKQKMNLF
jgi:hypothetical protein